MKRLIMWILVLVLLGIVASGCESVDDMFSSSRCSGIEYDNDSIEADQETVDYLKKVGLVKGHIVKWSGDIKLYVENEHLVKSVIIDEMLKVVDELNDLIWPRSMYFVETEEESNVVLSYYNHDEYVTKMWIGESAGEVYIRWNECYEIFEGEIIIDIGYGDRLVKSTVREEITQVTGLLVDTWDYTNSVFYEGGTLPVKYSRIDKKVIRLHEKLVAGMTGEDVDNMIK